MGKCSHCCLSLMLWYWDFLFTFFFLLCVYFFQLLMLGHSHGHTVWFDCIYSSSKKKSVCIARKSSWINEYTGYGWNPFHFYFFDNIYNMLKSAIVWCVSCLPYFTISSMQFIQSHMYVYISQYCIKRSIFHRIVAMIYYLFQYSCYLSSITRLGIILTKLFNSNNSVDN